MSFHVYILKSTRDGTLYVGHTNNLERRMRQHGTCSGKGYTANRGPWRLVHSEEHPSRAEAMKRERFLKSCKGARLKNRLAQSGP